MLIVASFFTVYKMNKPSRFIIIGSVASKHWFTDFRQPNDVDILSSTPNALTSNRFLDQQSHRLFDLVVDHSNDKTFADPNVLLTLKLSHVRHDQVFFEKTIHDIAFYKSHGCQVIEPLYDQLIPLWDEVRPNRVKLSNVKVEDFFTSTVTRKYNHDYLHELVAFNQRPLHESIRPDLTLVYCDPVLYQQLSSEHKLQLALEELMVTAIERYNITTNTSDINVYKAVKQALKLLITSMTRGWFARYYAENYPAIMKNNIKLLVDKIKQVVAQLETT